jgi:hypothetical protein
MRQATPSESPDSVRLLGPIWTASGLTIQAGCRFYCGDHWSSGTITATGVDFALVRTAKGISCCSDRRNIQTMEEARQFNNAQSRFKRHRQAVLSSLGMALGEEESNA